MKKNSEFRIQNSEFTVGALPRSAMNRLRRASKSGGLRPAKASAFTLIELVSVLAIIVVLLSIALGSYSGWTRAAGVEAAASLTATVFSHARELAITERLDTRVVCGNITPDGRAACGSIAVYTFGDDTNATLSLTMPTNTFPAGVCFSNTTEQAIEFRADGTCRPSTLFDSDNCARFVIVNSAGAAAKALTRIVEVNQLSGRIRVRREDDP
jgi:prepilin-type N-terminal cleavage/methylation domain-containing protein